MLKTENVKKNWKIFKNNALYMKLDLKLVIFLGIKLDLIYIKIIILKLNVKFENTQNYEIMHTNPSTHNSKANSFFNGT